MGTTKLTAGRGATPKTKVTQCGQAVPETRVTLDRERVKNWVLCRQREENGVSNY